MLQRVLIVAVASAGMFFTACRDRPDAPATGERLPPIPGSMFLPEAPPGARDIADAKPGAKPGDTLTLRGRIGGSKEPFVEGRAVFTLVDTRLKACGEGKEECCKTPWDFCCETREEITRNLATIQVVGDDGKPLKRGLNGVNGLKPLATVTIVGAVTDAGNDVLVVRASGMHVKP